MSFLNSLSALIRALCTDMCKLQDCDNQLSISDSEESADDDEGELDSDYIY